MTGAVDAQDVVAWSLVGSDCHGPVQGKPRGLAAGIEPGPCVVIGHRVIAEVGGFGTSPVVGLARRIGRGVIAADSTGRQTDRAMGLGVGRDIGVGPGARGTAAHSSNSASIASNSSLQRVQILLALALALSKNAPQLTHVTSEGVV